MSTLKVNSIEPANPGNEDYFLSRSWVNSNGTGTPSIRASGNVSSITDQGTGYYRVNFTTAMPDGNYAVIGSVGDDAAYADFVRIGTRSTTGVLIYTTSNGSKRGDPTFAAVAVFR